MSTNVLVLGSDCYARQDDAGGTYSVVPNLSLNGAAGSQRQAFLHFPGLPKSTDYVFSATLSVWLRGAWAGGPHTVTVERITALWKESQVPWNNRPATTTTNAVTAAVTAGADGARVDIDVTALVRDMLSAAQRYGVRLRLDTTGVKNLHSSDSATPDLRPLLTVNWSDYPTEANDLEPSGGQAVSLAKPVLSWAFEDIEGDAQGTYQVQLDDASTFATVLWDSGVVSSTDPFVDLSVAAGAPSTPVDVNRWWRVQVKDSGGLLAPWSDVAQFIRRAKGTLVISAPGPTATDTTTPDIVLTWTAPSGGVLDSLRYVLTEIDPQTGNAVLWDTRRRRATQPPPTISVPPGLITKEAGSSYRLDVYAWDTVDRVATPGDPRHIVATVTLTYAPPAAGIAAVTNFAAANLGDGSPAVRLTWQRAAVPTVGWQVRVDGRIVDDNIDALDLQTSPGNYAYNFWKAGPNISRSYDVRAVDLVSGKPKASQKAANAPLDYTSQPIGIWLIDPKTDPAASPRRLQLIDTQDASLVMGESGETFYPVGAQVPVRIVDSLRGYEGTVSGLIPLRADRDLLFDFKEAVGARYHLVANDLNIPVELGRISVNPRPDLRDSWDVTIEVFQVADFPMRAP